MAAAEAVRPVRNATEENAEDLPEAYTQAGYAAFVSAYPDLRTELTKDGKLIIMPPSGGESSHQSSIVGGRLFAWSELDGTGMTFDANGGYVLPNGAIRAPDASWIPRTRWNALSPEQKRKFMPLCPDFVVEVLSPTDSLAETQEKMREYLENGARLGWLINPRRKQVEVYRQGQDVEILVDPAFVSGDPVLPGFTLSLRGILD